MKITLNEYYERIVLFLSNIVNEFYHLFEGDSEPILGDTSGILIESFKGVSKSLVLSLGNALAEIGIPSINSE